MIPATTKIKVLMLSKTLTVGQIAIETNLTYKQISNYLSRNGIERKRTKGKKYGKRKRV